MDTRIRNVVAVSRHASFSRAAEALGITQSGVTKSVADLERQIGFTIFHRTPRGALPTEQGRDFLDRATRLMADFADLLGTNVEERDPYRGILRVGIFPAAIEWMFVNALANVVRKRPSIHLEIVTGASERGLPMLSRGDIDIALGMSAAFHAMPDIRSVKVGEIGAHWFVRRDHPLLALDPIELDHVVKFDFVSVSLSAPYADTVRDLFLSHGISPVGRMHIVDYFPLMRLIVAQSDAIGVIADDAARSDAFNRDFRVIEQPGIFPTVDVACATRSNWPAKPSVKLLINELLDRRGTVWTKTGN